MNTLADWLALLTRRHPKNIDLGLDRCGEVYLRLGSPRPAAKVVTVAGTNGKGSTVAYLAAMSAGLGQRYGTYTSPHLLRFNERICVQGTPVSDDTLTQAFDVVEAARESVSLTYFEFTTLAALVILQRSSLDFAVLEVGLGGRLDTVNLIDADCAVITAIGLDHQEYLGSDIASIAMEKAGIMRKGKAVVCSDPGLPEVILQMAGQLDAPVYRPGRDFNLTPVAGGGHGSLRFSMNDRSMRVMAPGMAGQHQVENLAGALAAFCLLYPRAFGAADEISTAVHHCQVAGRLQKVSNDPAILLDVGHNVLAAKAIAAQLRGGDASRIVCVIAMLADKAAERVAATLEPVCGYWVCVDSHGERGQPANTLARRIQLALPAAEVNPFASFSQAMENAIGRVGIDGTVLVFGSFSVVADAMRWLENRMRHECSDAAKIT